MQQLHHDAAQERWDLSAKLVESGRNPGDVRVDQLERIAGLEGGTSRERCIESRPERVEVTTKVDPATHASALFWGHVLKRALRPPTKRHLGRTLSAPECACPPESDQMRLECPRFDQDVSRPHATVNDARGVDACQSVDELLSNSEEVGKRERLVLEQRTQALPGQPLEYENGNVRGPAELDDAHDARTLRLAQGRELPL